MENMIGPPPPHFKRARWFDWFIFVLPALFLALLVTDIFEFLYTNGKNYPIGWSHENWWYSSLRYRSFHAYWAMGTIESVLVVLGLGFLFSKNKTLKLIGRVSMAGLTLLLGYLVGGGILREGLF